MFLSTFERKKFPHENKKNLEDIKSGYEKPKKRKEKKARRD